MLQKGVHFCRLNHWIALCRKGKEKGSSGGNLIPCNECQQKKNYCPQETRVFSTPQDRSPLFALIKENVFHLLVSGAVIQICTKREVIASYISTDLCDNFLGR